MKGHFLYVDRPRNVSWTGVAEYRLLAGLLRVRVPQSGIVKLEARDDGVMMSPEMFIDFPDTWLGKLIARYLTESRNVERRLYEHGQKELVYFKAQIERLGKQPGVEIARAIGTRLSKPVNTAARTTAHPLRKISHLVPPQGLTTSS